MKTVYVLRSFEYDREFTFTNIECVYFSEAKAKAEMKRLNEHQATRKTDTPIEFDVVEVKCDEEMNDDRL